MAKLRKIHSDDGITHWMFFCPGCKCSHHIICPPWTCNGDIESPTIRASVLVSKSQHYPRCHSFVTNGQIQFLADCEHELAGKTISLEDF